MDDVLFDEREETEREQNGQLNAIVYGVTEYIDVKHLFKEHFAT